MSSALPERDSAIGALERDRFTIVRELGSGGMASVYLAHDRVLDRQVAVKTLHPNLARGVGADRFLLEVRRTARLVHPNILPLFDSGSLDGILFYVMPFVDGQTLRHRLERDGRLPCAEALAIARDVTEAIAYAHSQSL